MAVKRARTYQLSTISDIAGFAALMFELAPNFDEHPAFHKVLIDSAVAPESRMKRLSQVITDRDWNEAQRIYDKKVWLKAIKK